MTAGEFASMEALYETLPEFVPKPIGYGSYTLNPNIHFFVCELVNMTGRIPEKRAFVRLLAELHTKGISPNGKYGFKVPTYKGTIPQYTNWHETWEEAFHHSMKWFVYAEEKSQGQDDEMRQLCDGLFDKVIPRLLRPLETGGRQIQPRLIHGDLWSGNTSTNIDKDTPVVYDGACLYAHNESALSHELYASHELTIGSGNGRLASSSTPDRETVYGGILQLLRSIPTERRPERPKSPVLPVRVPWPEYRKHSNIDQVDGILKALHFSRGTCDTGTCTYRWPLNQQTHQSNS